MAALAPYPRFRAVDDNNEPLVGGLVYSYVPGTSTPKATYTSQTLGTPNANPIVLDANGEATIYIDGDTDLVLQDASAVQQWGPIRASDGTANRTLTGITLAGTLTITSTAMTWSGNPTISGNVTFNNNLTVNGNTTLGSDGADSLTINVDDAAIPNGLTFTGGAFNFTPTTGNTNPTVTFGGASVGLTFSGLNRRITYSRIGDLYFFRILVQLSAKGSSTGVALIGSLPFTPGGAGAETTFPLNVVASGMTGLTGSLKAYATRSSTNIDLKQSTATGSDLNVTDANFTNSTRIEICGFTPA